MVKKRIQARCEYRKIACARREDGGIANTCDRLPQHHEYGMYLCAYHYDLIEDLHWFQEQREKGKLQSIREILESRYLAEEKEKNENALVKTREEILEDGLQLVNSAFNDTTAVRKADAPIPISEETPSDDLPISESRFDKIAFIARIRHLGWICYQIAAGQPYNIDPTPDQLDSLKQGVKFALEHPNMTAQENHDNWMQMKRSQGWVQGPVKDLEQKTHPDLVPYEQLPKIEQLKDHMDRIMNTEALKLYEKILIELM
jgi:hypothetical protein